MLGQLQDAGNTTTLAHYLTLLSSAGMLGGLEKFTTKTIKQRASSPKLQVLNTALMSAQQNKSLTQIRQDPERWGRWVESAVGAYLLNSTREHHYDLYYWRDGHYEVDFVIRYDELIIAIEVKSTTRKTYLSGMDAFAKAFPHAKLLQIGGQGLLLETFFSNPVSALLA